MAGVTMFFVLSGFLITTLLFEEHRRTRRIDRLAFYRRRVLRLLPALVLLLAAVAAYVIARQQLGGPSTAEAYNPRYLPRDSFAALFFIANWLRVRGTFIGQLSHTWSLAIEEQFYLVWPTVLILAAPFTRRRQTLAISVLLTLALLSILERIALWSGSGDRIYFGTDTRADALLLGCALALLLQRNGGIRISQWWTAPAVTGLVVGRRAIRDQPRCR